MVYLGPMKGKRPFSFIAEWTNTGFSAYSKKHPVVTTGATLQELKRNIVEAMNLLLEDDGVRVASKDILTRPARPQGLEDENPAQV